MVGWSPFLGRSPSNYNLFYRTQIWFPKLLTRKEFGSQISLNIVDEVIEVDELDKGNMWKMTFGGTRSLVEDDLQ